MGWWTFHVRVENTPYLSESFVCKRQHLSRVHIRRRAYADVDFCYTEFDREQPRLFVWYLPNGRLIFGLGLGLSLRCGPMYLRETIMGPFKNAATVSVKLSMVVGVIVSYVVGGLLSNPTQGEREEEHFLKHRAVRDFSFSACSFFAALTATARALKRGSLSRGYCLPCLPSLMLLPTMMATSR